MIFYNNLRSQQLYFQKKKKKPTQHKKINSIDDLFKANRRPPVQNQEVSLCHLRRSFGSASRSLPSSLRRFFGSSSGSLPSSSPTILRFGIQKSPFVVSDNPSLRYPEVSLHRLRESFGLASKSLPSSSADRPPARLPVFMNVVISTSTSFPLSSLPTRQRRCHLRQPQNGLSRHQNMKSDMTLISSR